MRARPAAFFDRDGVICEYVPELADLSQFKFRSGVALAIQKLNQAGYFVFVATNQPNIAKAKMTVAENDRIHKYMVEELARQGASIDEVFYCPHRVGGVIPSLSIECECRKPRPGMLKQALQKYGFSMEKSFMLGDTWRDVDCAHQFGIKGLAVCGGGGYPYSLYEDSAKDSLNVKPDGIFSGPLEAVEHWLGGELI